MLGINTKNRPLNETNFVFSLLIISLFNSIKQLLFNYLFIYNLLYFYISEDNNHFISLNAEKLSFTSGKEGISSSSSSFILRTSGS